MKKITTIVSAIFLLNLVAVGQIPSDANLRFHVENLSPTDFSGIVSNTQPDIEYEIQRRQGETNWISIGFILGSETTNWSKFDFPNTNDITVKTTLRVRSWIDSQGVGMPDWWQLKFFGKFVDTFDDPDGDGYNNLEEYLNGTDPTVFNHPPKGVSNVQAIRDRGNTNNVIVSWLGNPSATSYTIIRVLNGATNTYEIGRNATSWADSNAPSFGTPTRYSISANYSNTPAKFSPDSDPTYNPRLAIP